MKNPILILLYIIVIISPLKAQRARIYEQKVELNTYMYSDPDPIPDMEKSYPYWRFDGYTSEGMLKEWKMVILENDYIKVYITPEIGGKIWGAIEKSTGGEFLYFNDAVKFRDVALRGPWTSGGLEYNFGIMSHTSTCATPQDYVTLENEDGSVSCVIGAIDLHTGTKWNVEVNLQQDKAYFETIASYFNPGELPETFYLYMNAAAKTQGNLEFIFPGTNYIGHNGETGLWPVENGRQISYYEQNDFGPAKSYHVLNAYADFMGGYWHDDDFGFGHLTPYDERPGKKLWIWGLSDQGMIWEDLLTDSKGQYIEFQSGKLFNQAMESSTRTPFRHREFFPHDADITHEIWFPLKKTGGMVAASRFGVLNVINKGSIIEIRLSALQAINETLSVVSAGETKLNERVELEPLERYVTEIDMDDGKDFSIELGDHLLDYSSKNADMMVGRPLEPDTDINWESAIGLFTLGMELERQRTYLQGNAYVRASRYYELSLEKDPAYSPALNRIGLNLYRQMDYKNALIPILKSLAIDTYDGEANYYYGLIQQKLGNVPDAKSGFSIAAQSTTYRTAAYTELAKIFLREKNFRKAQVYSGKALAYNQYNLKALQVKAVAARLSEDAGLSDETLSAIEALDKTSPFALYEKIIRGAKNMEMLGKLVTNEMAFQTYLDLAITYFDLGLEEECVNVLKVAPDHPVILLWLAGLDKDQSSVWLEKALRYSPDFVFPYRTETYDILKNLVKTEDNWKLKYYMSLICWKKGLYDLAREWMIACGTEPGYAPFYLAKAVLFENDAGLAGEAIRMAGKIEGHDWRTDLLMTDLLLNEKNYKEAAALAKQTLGKKPEVAALGINYGISLLRNGDYDKCIGFLESFKVLPYEGANEGRSVYHEACIRASFEAIRQNKFNRAINYADKAKNWPVNLGAGRPYEVDEKLENYIIAICHENAGNKNEAKKYYIKVADDTLHGISEKETSFYLRMKALNKLGRVDEATALMNTLLIAEPDNNYVLWAEANESGEKNTEKELPSGSGIVSLDDHFLLVRDLFSIID